MRAFCYRVERPLAPDEAMGDCPWTVRLLVTDNDGIERVCEPDEPAYAEVMTRLQAAMEQIQSTLGF